MTGTSRKAPRTLPQRTCVGCRTIMPKKTMLRLVRTPEGVMIDPTGKLAGRGAYLHNRRSCWEKGLHGQLAHALKTELTTGDTRRLHEFMETLPEDVESPAENGKVRMD